MMPPKHFLVLLEELFYTSKNFVMRDIGGISNATFHRHSATL